MSEFKLVADFSPTGDQPKAVEGLIIGLEEGKEHQTLLGVTGSGKTFTMACVIEKTQRPTLVLAHNKTLAAQLATELQDFFPENAKRSLTSTCNLRFAGTSNVLDIDPPILPTRLPLM